MHLVGQLEGGYLPPGGALVRLRIGIGAARTTYGIREHVERERTLLDYVHVRARGPELGPGLLVPDRLPAHGQLPLRTGVQPADNRDRGRPSVVVVLVDAVANGTPAPSCPAPRSLAAPQTFATGVAHRAYGHETESWRMRTRAGRTSQVDRRGRQRI